MNKLLIFCCIVLISACSRDKIPYAISGTVLNELGYGVPNCAVLINYSDTLYTNQFGVYSINNLVGTTRIKALSNEYTFSPDSIVVEEVASNLNFQATRIITEQEQQLFSWFNAQQLPNGLVPSVENGTVISLYDNALAVLVYLVNNDYERAERVLDFFNARINSELKQGVGGFSQFRNPSGTPNNHRWMGDNAWLLLAINNYHALTNSTKYSTMAQEITTWLLSLQDSDGGLFAGYNANNELLNYKVTEGIIDAFCAIQGYTEAHKNMLSYLEAERWSAESQSLVSWPDNPPYLYALDVHPWGYLIFEDFPSATLTFASRFINTQNLTNGLPISGYCFDDDLDAVWIEGTAQMCLALGYAGYTTEKELHLQEIRKTQINSTIHSNAAGFPYATNLGTGYGADVLWEGADTKSAVSSGAWYLFAITNFNPFAVGKPKNMPESDKFWVTN